MISDSQEWVRTVGTFIGGTAAILVAGLSIYGYVLNKKLERVKWAQKLYESFYEKELYKRIRRALDRGDNDEENLKLMLTPDWIDDFYDYLNFFEFVAFLWDSDQLTNAEVDALFGYYLELLKSDALRAEVKTKSWSYEYLTKLLDADLSKPKMRWWMEGID